MKTIEIKGELTGAQVVRDMSMYDPQPTKAITVSVRVEAGTLEQASAAVEAMKEMIHTPVNLYVGSPALVPPVWAQDSPLAQMVNQVARAIQEWAASDAVRNAVATMNAAMAEAQRTSDELSLLKEQPPARRRKRASLIGKRRPYGYEE